jgi:hypothetical protein
LKWFHYLLCASEPPPDLLFLRFTTGTGAHAWFLLVQTALLSALGLLLGFPFQAQAMIAAIVYVCSRVNPMEKMYENTRPPSSVSDSHAFEHTERHKVYLRAPIDMLFFSFTHGVVLLTFTGRSNLAS